MRIWKGKEKEVAIFKETEMLFIQGETVDIQKVLEIARENNIRQLYFGAGKTEFKDFGKLGLVPKSRYIIIIETTKPNKVPLNSRFTVIQRFEPKIIFPKSIIKIETTFRILTIQSEQLHKTYKSCLDVETLMYDSDELLWEDK